MKERMTGLNSGNLRDYLAFCVALASLALIAIYVRGIYLYGARILPEPVFWMFASALSASLLCLVFSRNEKVCLTAILLSAFIIVSIPFLRFYFFGADLLGEYFVAATTREAGMWLSGRSIGNNFVLLTWYFQKPTELFSRYFSSTSVTIVPAILSDLTGASIRVVLWILISTISTTVVLVCYLITKKCLNQTTAALSCVVFIFCTYYLGRFPNLLREDAGMLFLLLAVLSIVIGGRKNWALTGLWLVILPMSHYAFSLLGPYVIFLLFISNKVYENRFAIRILKKFAPGLGSEGAGGRISISSNTLLFSILAGLSYLLFVAYLIFGTIYSGFAGAFGALLGRAPWLETSLQTHILLSSLGPFHSLVQWLERGMAIVGLFLVIRMFKTRKANSFAFLGGGLLFIAVILGVLPVTNLLFDLDRTMQLALIGFSTFIAVTLLRIGFRPRIRTIVGFLLISLILFETLQSPILYSSAAEMSQSDYIFSFTNLVSFYQASDFYYAGWVKTYVQTNAVFASDTRGCNLLLAAERICATPSGSNVTDTIALLESGKTDYYLALFYTYTYMSFPRAQLNSTQIGTLLNSSHLDRVYDDSRATDFTYVP